jgi:uncharacterized membrane protein SirB2
MLSYALLKFVHRGCVVGGLVALYGLFGTIALRRPRTPPVRALACGAALATFGVIVYVAVTRSPLPGLIP